MKNLYWGSPQMPPQQGGVHHGHCDQDEVELAQRDLDIVCQREWAWWPSWCCFAIDFQNCWWPESHEIAYWKINGYFGWWWQWAARWAVCHKRTEDILQLQFEAVQEPQSIFQPECKYSWSWQQFLKDGIVLLEHEACQEQPLDILDTFKSRRGTLPISVGSATEWLTW